MNWRWFVIIAGIVIVLYGWFSSDEGMARAKLRRRREQFKESWGGTAADLFHAQRDPTVKETVGGGVERFFMLVIGAGLILVGILWNRIAEFLGQYFEPVP